MSLENSSDLKLRLVELNQWQLQQKKKLKEFQETQRQLLNVENQCVLKNKDFLNKKDMEKNLNNEYTQQMGKIFKNCTSHYNLPQPRCDFRELSEPQIIGYSQTCSFLDNYNENKTDLVNNVMINEENQQPKKFLRRGDGLARFRMTLEDFKTPPQIYKEKRIKTYLNKKSNECTKIQSKRSKHLQNKNRIGHYFPKIKKEESSFALNIYIPQQSKYNKKFKNYQDKDEMERKNNKIDSETSENIRKSKISEFRSFDSLSKPKTCDYNLKTSCLAEEEINNSKKNFLTKTDLTSVFCGQLEANKRDEELKAFEILEQKLDDSSFCSTSSLISKLVELSTASNQTNTIENKRHFNSELQSHSQLLKDDRFDIHNNKPMVLDCKESNEKPECDTVLRTRIEGTRTCEAFPRGNDFLNVLVINKDESQTANRNINSQKSTLINEFKERSDNCSNKVEFERLTLKNRPVEVNGLNFTCEKPIGVLENIANEECKYNKIKLNEEKGKKIADQKEMDDDSDDYNYKDMEDDNQKQISLKLQRKGLQDNVKQLINWEYQGRKKPIKKVVKRIKPKTVKTDKKGRTTNIEQSEKIVLNSALIRERLDELENEIKIFRKESGRVEKLQKECFQEKLKLSKERKEFEKQITEEKKQLEERIAESQKKLQKERNVFETYCREVKNRPSRQEREELSQLKKEMEKLTEVTATKEARWGASQARLRNQIKQLEKENIRLKAENENLKKAISKKVSFESEKSLNAKIMRVINSELEKMKPSISRNFRTNSSSPCSIIMPSSARYDKTIFEKPLRRINSAPNIKKSTIIKENAFNSSETNSTGYFSLNSEMESNERIVEDFPLSDNNLSDMSSLTQKKQSVDFFSTGTTIKRKNIYDENNGDMSAAIRETIFQNNLETDNLNSLEFDSHQLKNNDSKKEVENPHKCDYFGTREVEKNGRPNTDEFRILNFPPEENIDNGVEEISDNRSQKFRLSGHDGIRNRILEDGSKEIFYSNGNIKRIFPDGKLVKIIYYNGDIKERNEENGSEKYYYSETKTWHTTYKNGLEVLDFPNGQTERRYPDGSTEISFPNGCVRYCDSTGKDEWRFLDGTVIKTKESGQKILLMPNGQKEVHTNKYKQREYPDGTVKIVYSDGSQETRYASGRVRLKDKDGNLVMDSGEIR